MLQKTIPISLALALEKSAEAVGRAREAMALAPHPDVLKRFIREAEQDALAWVEGASFDPDRLAIDYGYSPRAWQNWPYAFVRAFDRPLESAALPDAQRVTQWLTRQKPDSIVPVGWDTSPVASQDRLETWVKLARRSADLPRMLAAADLAARFARAAPLIRGNAVIGVILAEHYALSNETLSAGGIVAIGFKRHGTSWRTLVQGAVEDDLDEISVEAAEFRCRNAWLAGLQAGAEHVISLEKRIRIWLAKLDDACQSRRKSSNLRSLVLLTGKHTSLTAARAAKSLKLSRQATTRLIDQACEYHLVREVTQGSSFRRYVAAI